MPTMVMKHYFCKYPDGSIHVDNFVGSYQGQHHVHTAKSFAKWRTLVDATSVQELKSTQRAACGCGLHPGQVREYDGRIWDNPVFGED